MSHLRLLICRVDDDTEQMTELDRLDLPATPPDAGAAGVVGRCRDGHGRERALSSAAVAV
ncbi:MAG TPA: hypothetical protein VFE42_22215 [Chloroflexota bacterium]|nr:hypothetical protein [Chloroflexota bacterium]